MEKSFGQLIEDYLTKGDIKNARNLINRLAEENKLEDLWQVVSYMKEDTKTDEIVKKWVKIEENVNLKSDEKPLSDLLIEENVNLKSDEKPLSDLLLDTRNRSLANMSANGLSKLMMSMQDQAEEYIFWDDLEKSLKESIQNKKEMKEFLMDKIIGMSEEDIDFVEKNDQRYPGRKDLEKLFGEDVSDKLFHYKSIENIQPSGIETIDDAIKKYHDNLKASLTHGKVDLTKFVAGKNVDELDLKDLDKIVGVVDKISFGDLCPPGLLAYREGIYSRVNNESYVDLYNSALENVGMDSILAFKKGLLIENLDKRVTYLDRYSVNEASDELKREVVDAKVIIALLRGYVSDLPDKVVKNKPVETDPNEMSKIISDAKEFIKESKSMNVKINVLLGIDYCVQALFPGTQFATKLRELITDVLKKVCGSKNETQPEAEVDNDTIQNLQSNKVKFDDLVSKFDESLSTIEDLNKSFPVRVMEFFSKQAGVYEEPEEKFNRPKF